MAKSRRAIAEELLDLHIEHADLFAKIETLKEGLRGYSRTEGSGFSEEIEGKGKVTVSKESVAKLKGILPICVAETFIKLSEARRKTLIKRGIIEMKEIWSEDRKPSVSVKTAA